MEKMNCDIIKDLIPSYVDEVCSQATKKCVETHLEECGECRLIAARLRNNALFGEKLEQKGLDGLKKIRRTLTIQRMINYGILLFLVYCGIQLFLVHHANFALFTHPGILETICILMVLVSGAGHREKQSPGRASYVCGAVSLSMAVYFILLFLYFIMQLTPDTETFLGMELSNTGPFLDKQLAVAFTAQIAFFLYNLWCVLKGDRRCRWLLCLNIMGIFLTINYDLLMYRMDNYDILKLAYLYSTLESVVPGILGITASLLISRRQEKQAAGEAAL